MAPEDDAMDPEPEYYYFVAKPKALCRRYEQRFPLNNKLYKHLKSYKTVKGLVPEKEAPNYKVTKAPNYKVIKRTLIDPKLSNETFRL